MNVSVIKTLIATNGGEVWYDRINIYRKGTMQKGKTALNCLSDLDFTALKLLWAKLYKVILEKFSVIF